MGVCVHVFFLGGGMGWVFTSTALVVAWMARYLTCYSDLTSFGFCEPLLPPYTSYRCHTSLKMSSAIAGYSFVRSMHRGRHDSQVSAGMSAMS